MHQNSVPKDATRFRSSPQIGLCAPLFVQCLRSSCRSRHPQRSRCPSRMTHEQRFPIGCGRKPITPLRLFLVPVGLLGDRSTQYSGSGVVKCSFFLALATTPMRGNTVMLITTGWKPGRPETRSIRPIADVRNADTSSVESPGRESRGGRRFKRNTAPRRPSTYVLASDTEVRPRRRAKFVRGHPPSARCGRPFDAPLCLALRFRLAAAPVSGTL